MGSGWVDGLIQGLRQGMERWELTLSNQDRRDLRDGGWVSRRGLW